MIRMGLLTGLALILIALAVPAIARADSAVHAGNRFRAVAEGGRAVLAIAAGSILFLLAMRAR